MKSDLLLEDVKLHIDNMYDQLDAAVIDTWPVDGLEITVDGTLYIIQVKAAE